MIIYSSLLLRLTLLQIHFRKEVYFSADESKYRLKYL